ncbi:MAG: hypothetical protein ACTHOF_18500 [Flavisolibacter sp.]|jgi:hypothetical protein
MQIKKEDTSVNHQTHSHGEGQQNNIRPDDQQMNDTNAEPMSNMMRDSEGQRKGRAQEQKNENSRKNQP